MRINWDGEISGYAENPGNWIFLCRWTTSAILSLNKLVQTSVLGYIFIYLQIKH
jgi:hypothetical protein